MKKSRFTDSQIIAVLKQAEAGTAVPELCREHDISSATFYKWPGKFGGMDASLMFQIKDLQDENRHLKKMHAEAQLSPDLLKEAMSKNVWSAPGLQGPQLDDPSRLHKCIRPLASRQLLAAKP